MNKLLTLLICFSMHFVVAQQVQSPSKHITLDFSLNNQGQPMYQVSYKGKTVVKPSMMGISLKDNTALTTNFSITKTEQATVNESWQPILGEDSNINNHYNQATFQLTQKETNRQLTIVFKVYDEGVAFRYEFPFQERVNYFVISDENTEFNLTGNHKTFWIPGDYDSQEYVYNETKLSEVDNSILDLDNGIALKTIESQYRVQSPLMMKSDDGLYINIFEAAVVNYPVMHLDVDVKTFALKANLTPNAIGDKAYLRTPSTTPWRTVMVSDDARDIVSSKLILNLNEPNKIKDTSWIKPMKYVGIWWEMHAGVTTWDYAGCQNAQNSQGDLVASGKHGATTENTKRYIDFAAKHGFDGVLVEGWNVGWEDWFGNWKEDVFDFLTPYPDFDIEAV